MNFLSEKNNFFGIIRLGRNDKRDKTQFGQVTKKNNNNGRNIETKGYILKLITAVIYGFP